MIYITISLSTPINGGEEGSDTELAELLEDETSNVDKILDIIPELSYSINFNQNSIWHVYDVFEHILHVIDGVDKDIELRLAAFFHDIGKPFVYKEDENGIPMITEINLRHVAFTSTFANAGLNFSEAQLLCMLERENDIPVKGTLEFPENNAMLRDVDGLPIYTERFMMPKLGEAFVVE